MTDPRQITDLPVATSLADTDLLLVRQGLEDKQMTGSVLLANAMKGSNNLSDLDDAPTARTNLGVPSATDVLLKANNLSDLANAASARSNLGLTIGLNVQAWSLQLDALSAMSSTGLISRTGSSTFSQRTLMPPAAGMTITNPAGITGNPTFALANDLAALEGLASSGFAVRTATDIWAQRTLTPGSNKVSIIYGDGVAGNPVIDIIEANLSLDNIPGNMPISRGGTGQATKTTAFDALSPLTSQGDVIYHNGTNNVRLAAGTTNYLFQTKGNAANPVYVAPAQVGGDVFLGSFSSISGALEYRDINKAVQNVGSRVSSLLIKICGIAAYPTAHQLYMQLGFNYPSGGIIPYPATPNYHADSYDWKGSDGSGSADIGFNIGSGNIMATSSGLGAKLFTATIELSLGGQDDRIYGGLSSYPFFAINGTYSLYNSSSAFKSGSIGGALLARSTVIAPYPYNISACLTAIKIFPTAGSISTSGNFPNDVNGSTSNTAFSWGAVNLYARTF